MDNFNAQLSHGRQLFESLVVHLNADKPLSEFDKKITQLTFEEVRDEDNILYMPPKNLSLPNSQRHLQRGFSLEWARYYKKGGILGIKPHVCYYFEYNIDTRRLDLSHVGGTMPIQEFGGIDASAFYRIE
jgi:hypothetical protein